MIVHRRSSNEVVIDSSAVTTLHVHSHVEILPKSDPTVFTLDLKLVLELILSEKEELSRSSKSSPAEDLGTYSAGDHAVASGGSLCTTSSSSSSLNWTQDSTTEGLTGSLSFTSSSGAFKMFFYLPTRI